MQKKLNPTPETWSELCKRAGQRYSDLYDIVRPILQAVKERGDEAVREYVGKFDGVDIEDFRVSDLEFEKAIESVSPELKQAIITAKNNITKFHEAQREPIRKIETTQGVVCWRKSTPIASVGLYIPSQNAPLFSTILMLGIPATIAGCKEIVLCTPPSKTGKIHPVILYTAHLLGIRQVRKCGGVQAIGAMAYGTATTPKVDKIFGPSNAYVTAAKQLVAEQGTSIDLPAGPSEVLVIADQTANPIFVAADLLSQAEHGTDSQVVLCTNSEAMADAVLAEVEKQLASLPRKEVALESLSASHVLVFNTLDEAMRFSNEYAPEHLILATENPEMLAEQVVNAGSVFLGHYTPESAGDYASGTNHTLPTAGYARATGGVSLDSFVKKITFQHISKEGIQNLGNTIELMAEAEGLHAHKNAVSVRLADLA